MFIEQKKVINVANYLAAMPTSASFRIASAIDAKALARLKRVGFNIPPQTGETILPKPIGPVSRFNSEGRFVVRKDLPKEMRYVRTVQWRLKEYHGDTYIEREDFRDINKLCYPRDIVTPPSVEITYVAEPQPLVISHILMNNLASHENIKHIINLFLELFGKCELVDLSLATFPMPIIKKVNWEFLPQGANPWDAVKACLIAKAGIISNGTQAVILDRHTTIVSHSPTQIIKGQGGFYDYMAYEFEAQGIVVLDSIRFGNTIYVLSSDWKAASKLTKAEIIRGKIAVARIIHSAGWKAELGALLKKLTPTKPSVNLAG